MKKIVILSCLVMLVSISLFARYENFSREGSRGDSRSVPTLIDYQGRLTDGEGDPIAGSVSIVFSIYADSSGGVALWSETQVSVQVSDGLFHVLLGSETAFPSDLFDESNRWLGINVNADGEMTPRCRMGSVPYAIQSASAAPDSDWTISGNDVYRETGNVGVGNINPSYDLDVAGDINFTGEFYQDGSPFSCGAGGGDSLWNANGTSIYYNEGNVGIGLTAPDYPLHVKGYAKFQPSASSDSYAVFGSISYKAQLLFYDGTDYTTAIRSLGDSYFNGGDVGIGTTSPDTKLEVSGTGDQYIRVTSTDNQRAGIEFIRSGNTYRDWRLYDNGGNLHLNYDGNGFIDDDGTNLMFWNYQYGRVGIGTENPASKLEVVGTVNATAFVGDGSQLTGIETGGDTDWTESGNDIYRETGNVGIGTNNPTEALDIVGNLKVDDIYNHDGLLSLHSDGSTVVNLGPNGGYYGSWFIVKDPDDNIVFMISQVGPSFFYGDMSVDGSAQFSGGDGAVQLLLKADIDDAGGESEHPTMSFSQDGGNVVGNIGFFDDYGSNDFAMYNSYSGGGLSFGAGDSKALEIDSDHNFHITRPDGIKTVKIEASETGSDGSQLIMYDSNGNGTVEIDTESNIGSYMDFYTNNYVRTVRIQSTKTADGSDGSQIQLYKADGTASITLDAEYGGEGGNGRIFTEVLEITGGSDIAEPFDIEISDGIEPGMVLTIDPENPGKLKLAEKAYDRCVAGIVSGAGGINAGMIMGQNKSVADGEYPVALTGRVYCYADASNGAIRPGDLLTTSDISGYAMKVSDHAKAQGAIIGKAMSSLKKGKGLVLVLVSLQ